jgi:glutaminase
MYTPLPIDKVPGPSYLSTGHLPPLERVTELVDEAYALYTPVDEGKVADYTPALAKVPRNLFGICVVGVEGNVYAVGDADHEFSIQSVSKPFVFALVYLRNRGIAKLLEGYGRMCFDALEYTDVYTKQCSPKVNAQDLAVMGATLADAEATR